MAKPDRTEAALLELLEETDGGRVALIRPRFAALRESGHVELAIAHRGGVTVYVAGTIREAADEAAHAIRSGEDEDPVAAWRRLRRMQRELVLETLSEAKARHMRRAADAILGSDNVRAGAEYTKADAFEAAIQELVFIETDETGAELPPTEHLRPIQPRTKRAPV